MRKALPQMLEIAALLVAHEARAITSEPAKYAATAICDKLRPMLSTLMGATGFRTLLVRALTLASVESPILSALTVDGEGSLVPANAAHDTTAALHETDASVALVAQLLSLLVAFIGDALTLQLLAEIWPRQLTRASNSRTGDRT